MHATSIRLVQQILLDDGTLEIEFAFHLGDNGVMKAHRTPFSTAC